MESEVIIISIPNIPIQFKREIEEVNKLSLRQLDKILEEMVLQSGIRDGKKRYIFQKKGQIISMITQIGQLVNTSSQKHQITFNILDKGKFQDEQILNMVLSKFHLPHQILEKQQGKLKVPNKLGDWFKIIEQNNIQVKDIDQFNDFLDEIYRYTVIHKYVKTPYILTPELYKDINDAYNDKYINNDTNKRYNFETEDPLFVIIVSAINCLQDNRDKIMSILAKLVLWKQKNSALDEIKGEKSPFQKTLQFIKVMPILQQLEQGMIIKLLSSSQKQQKQMGFLLLFDKMYTKMYQQQMNKTQQSMPRQYFDLACILAQLNHHQMFQKKRDQQFFKIVQQSTKQLQILLSSIPIEDNEIREKSQLFLRSKVSQQTKQSYSLLSTMRINNNKIKDKKQSLSTIRINKNKIKEKSQLQRSTGEQSKIEYQNIMGRDQYQQRQAYRKYQDQIRKNNLRYQQKQRQINRGYQDQKRLINRRQQRQQRQINRRYQDQKRLINRRYQNQRRQGNNQTNQLQRINQIYQDQRKQVYQRNQRQRGQINQKYQLYRKQIHENYQQQRKQINRKYQHRGIQASQRNQSQLRQVNQRQQHEGSEINQRCQQARVINQRQHQQNPSYIIQTQSQILNNSQLASSHLQGFMKNLYQKFKAIFIDRNYSDQLFEKLKFAFIDGYSMLVRSDYGYKKLEKYNIQKDKKLNFQIDNNAIIGILGDWGTGQPDAMDLLEQLVVKENANIIIHIGDVYYAGTKQEFEKLTKKIEQIRDRHPKKTFDFYAIPGNHDYYSGGKDFLNFASRQAYTFFSLQEKDKRFQIIALDTGRNGSQLKSPFYPTTIQKQQLEWAKNKIANFEGQTILLIHHQIFSVFQEVAYTQYQNYYNPQLNTLLHQQFFQVFPKISCLIWGHQHKFVVYKPNAYGIPLCRLVGNSAWQDQITYRNNQKYNQSDIVVKQHYPQSKKGYNDHTAMIITANNDQKNSLKFKYIHMTSTSIYQKSKRRQTSLIQDVFPLLKEKVMINKQYYIKDASGLSFSLHNQSNQPYIWFNYKPLAISFIPENKNKNMEALKTGMKFSLCATYEQHNRTPISIQKGPFFETKYLATTKQIKNTADLFYFIKRDKNNKQQEIYCGESVVLIEQKTGQPIFRASGKFIYYYPALIEYKSTSQVDFSKHARPLQIYNPEGAKRVQP